MLPLLGFCLLLAVALAASAQTGGVEGLAFTGAIALAFLLGSIDRRDPFRLRAARLPDALSARAVLETDLMDRDGALFIALEIDDVRQVGKRLGARALGDMTDQLAQRLRARVRGGDGFSVLAPGRFGVRLQQAGPVDLELGIRAGQRLMACANDPLRVDGMAVHCALSAGFAHAGQLRGLSPVPGLLDAAERALAAAQDAGPRSLVSFEPAMMTAPPRKGSGDRHRAAELRRAIAGGGIVAWFQPQIATDTGALAGVEALARWAHPEHGLLPPGEFLELARSAGCTAKLTDAMLAAALGQLAAWRRAGLEVPRISVNFGAADLADPTLVDRVLWALDAAGLAPSDIGIEILESVVASADPDDMVCRNVLALGARGCWVELDDFGTGSTSIAGIRRFGVRRIKLDRSLVTALDRDAGQLATVAAVLTMADQLGVEVLAEGVETPAEHHALAQLGVPHVQGHAVARPMAAADATAWIARRARILAESPAPARPARPQRTNGAVAAKGRGSPIGGETA
ncbi:EAL domain-containing protein [Oceaniglobus roseus]|uniref:EAL domain-containing protein n=1 Tax=Oceaniglobus roseus TaxID=1737570 RepID=UPI0012FFEC5D|nr:EAL domain-containing protein [Kandeliimicrobium roseum]